MQKTPILADEEREVPLIISKMFNDKELKQLPIK
jgi:hypothetical protein